jgi:hypothetical protein
MLRAIEVASSTDSAKNSVNLTVVVRGTVNDEDIIQRAVYQFSTIFTRSGKNKGQSKIIPDGVWGCG